MPAERVSMRCVREIFRLKHECGVSDRAIARGTGVARSTVRCCLARVAAAGLGWPLPSSLTDQGWRRCCSLRLAAPGRARGAKTSRIGRRSIANCGARRDVAMLLWEEYRAFIRQGYGYSRWCELYRGWEGRLSPTMRQVHPAGERLFVDYAGQTVEVVDGSTGELRPVQVFVAVLGASNYTYAEASWTQTPAGLDRLACSGAGISRRRAAADRARQPAAGVLRANWYEPGINPTYRDMAAHYGTAILPTRVRKPRDKAKVEVGVLVVERWILARLRNQRFFSLAELNAAIAALRRRPQRAADAQARRQPPPAVRGTGPPGLSPLPSEPYIYAEWRIRRVSPRLSRRCRRSLLLGAASAVARADRGAHHRAHRRVVPQGRARRRPCRAAAARGRHTTLAEHMPQVPPPPCRVDDRAHRKEAEAIGAATATLTM